MFSPIIAKKLPYCKKNKAPLCKGSWRANRATEGLTTPPAFVLAPHKCHLPLHRGGLLGYLKNMQLLYLFLDDSLHLVPLFLHIGNQLKLGTGTV